jgi:hypothetical protein
MPDVNFEEKKSSDRHDQKDHSEEESSDEELGGALLLGPRARDTEGHDKGFRQPG